MFVKTQTSNFASLIIQGDSCNDTQEQCECDFTKREIVRERDLELLNMQNNFT